MKQKNKHNLKKILPLYFEKKWQIIIAITLSILTGIASILSPILSANVLSNLAETQFQKAINLALILAVIMIVNNILCAAIDFLYNRINTRVQHKLTNKLVSSVVCTKMSKLESVRIGSITERLGMDIYNVSASFIQFNEMFFEILTNLAFFIYIAFLNIWIFLILLVYVVILYIICIWKARVWISGRKKVKALKDKSRSAYIGQVSGIRDVKLLNIKDNTLSFASDLDIQTIGTELKYADKRTILRRVQGILSSIFGALFIILGIVFVDKNFLLLTGFLIIYSYYGRVESLVQYISNLKENFAEGEVSASRVFEVIDEYEKETYGTREISYFSGLVEMKDVNFSYDGKNQILKNINISFLPGETTAIVGKSGCGKTTILSLLSKLYDIKDGEILFDGININELTENSLRSSIGIVSQAPYIFNTTVRQNLLFVKPDATENELIDVLKKSQIYADIQKFENGIDAEIGENGIKLSGGQKQRIAIARLLLKNSKVIVFDEATSALDNENQGKIVELLNGLKKEKTIIIVAHRLSTIVDADKIYYIEDGANIESGTHKYLMKNCKEYEELYKLEEENSKRTDETGNKRSNEKVEG